MVCANVFGLLLEHKLLALMEFAARSSYFSNAALEGLSGLQVSMRAVWIPSETPHSVAMSRPVSMRTLYFLPRLVRTLPAKCLVMNVSSLLRELILHACKFPKLNKKAPVRRVIIEIIVDQWEAAHSIPLQLPHPTDSRAMRVAQVLLADPGKQRTLETLCEDCGAGKGTIERLFITETRMTFSKWRQQLRLLHAMQLLASGEKVTGA